MLTIGIVSDFGGCLIHTFIAVGAEEGGRRQWRCRKVRHFQVEVHSSDKRLKSALGS
jgi:hypothetical protein